MPKSRRRQTSPRKRQTTQRRRQTSPRKEKTRTSPRKEKTRTSQRSRKSTSIKNNAEFNLFELLMNVDLNTNKVKKYLNKKITNKHPYLN